MSRLKDLLPARFKGISFFVRSEAITEGGRRIILHDYPNSSQRFVEDLGRLPQKFSITAFVTGPDFLSRSDQLQKALNEPGAGRLSMPTLGAITVFALPYRMDATQAAVGEIRFELSFTTGRSISGPTRAPASVESVFSAGDNARLKIGNALQKKWKAPKETSGVLTAIYDLEKCAKSTDQFLKSLNNAAEWKSTTDFLGFNAPSIIRSALYIRRVFVDNLWRTVSTGLSGGAGLASLLGLTRYGAALSLLLADIKSARSGPEKKTSTTIPTWPKTTANRINRNDNRLTLVNTHRVCALTSAYEQAADKAYQTDGELDFARLALETEHARLMRVDTENRDLVQSQPEVRQAIEEIRLLTLEVLDQKEQSAFVLTSLDVKTPKSAYMLSYELYAESFSSTEAANERAIILRGLNPSLPADKLAGSVMVLQS